MKEKDFIYIKKAQLHDVVSLALQDDAESHTKHYQLEKAKCSACGSDTASLWVVRELIAQPSFRYLEFFEFHQSKTQGWGFKGYSEEEGIPYLDCPLLLLMSAGELTNSSWRERVFKHQGEKYNIPHGAWLHSTSGVTLPNNEITKDFQFIGVDLFSCPRGKKWRLPSKVVGKIVKEGFGIALSRA